MNLDRMIFSPGDKVVRVSGQRGGAPKWHGKVRRVEYGKVYCIEDFWEGPQYNTVMLVGFGGWRYSHNGSKVGFYAGAFRKIEEIRLCVRTAEMAKKKGNKTVLVNSYEP